MQKIITSISSGVFFLYDFACNAQIYINILFFFTASINYIGY